MNRLARMTGTVFGVGYLRPAPGTWGSLVTLPIAWAFHVLGGFPLLVIACVGIFAAGWWATLEMTKDSDAHDPSEIVVDEVVGQIIAVLPISYSAWTLNLDVTALWPGWVAAFVLFRMFDIAKPWPISWADQREDAFGVMLDDVLAGVIAALGVIGMAAVAHMIFRF
jgi:phosphatidylglycerophosphatase A